MPHQPFTRLLPTALLGATLLAGCAKHDPDPTPTATTADVTIDVENVVGTEPLELDTHVYTSPANQSFTVTSFRYYLSNFKLLKADGSSYSVPDSYFLVRELRAGDPWTDTGKHIVLPDIPVGTYTGVSFLIGVDEERNTSGAQTGALSPDNYMFWSWRQGYIFLQMEGYSAQSGDAGTHLLSYHIGDFSRPNNLREVAPPLPGTGTLRVQGGHSPGLHLRANLLRLLVGATPQTSYPVDFGPFWSAVGGAPAGQVATNYSGSDARDVVGTNSMFTVSSVQE